jgi:hypothetical protein
MRIASLLFLILALVFMCSFAVAQTSASPPDTSYTLQTVSPAVAQIAVLHITSIGNELADSVLARVTTISQIDSPANCAYLRSIRHRQRRDERTLAINNTAKAKPKRASAQRMWAYGQAVYPLLA